LAGLRMTDNRLQKEDAGFTLIEVLVAVVILSTGIVLVLQAFNTQLVALGASREILYSHMLAREKLAELENEAIVEGKIERGTSNGRFSGEHENYLWQLNVRPIAVTDDIPVEERQIAATLNEISISVQKDNSDRICSMTTYITCIQEKNP
jgi:prepilin-type N-terminal cleavage/methylation domain-containing protein